MLSFKKSSVHFSQDTFLGFMTDALKREREEMFLAIIGQICTGNFSITNVLMDLDKVKRKEVIGRKRKAAQALGMNSQKRWLVTSLKSPKCIDRDVLNLYCYNEGEKEGTDSVKAGIGPGLGTLCCKSLNYREWIMVFSLLYLKLSSFKWNFYLK